MVHIKKKKKSLKRKKEKQMPQRQPRGPRPCFSFPENALSSPQGLVTSTHTVPLVPIGSPDGLPKGLF